MGVWVWREASTNSYPYQTNTVSIGPSHHGTRTIVQPCWPLSLTPVSSSTWQTVWSMFLAYQKARLSAFNVVTYKEDKIINFINFILGVADRCSRKSLAHPLRRSFFFFQEGQMPAGLSSLKGRENKTGQLSGSKKSVKIQRGEGSTNVELRETSPPWAHVHRYREREKHGMEALHSAQVVLFAPTIDSYTITKGGKCFEPNTASSLRNFEFLISDTVPQLFCLDSCPLPSSGPHIVSETGWACRNCAQKTRSFWFSWCLSCLKTKSTGLHFWFKWVICIEKFISTGHKDMVVKEGNKKFNYDRILKVAVNWRQGAEWPL